MRFQKIPNSPAIYKQIFGVEAMSNRIAQLKTKAHPALLLILLFILFTSGCAVEAAKNNVENNKYKAAENSRLNTVQESSIKIQPNSPADTVRVFYKDLREQHFREALFLTNLRPAIEGLTENELKDLQVDFAPLARQIPADVEINGEIISGNSATVTAKLPDNETEKIELQQIRLRRENDVWIILSVDEASEALIKKEGKNYFFLLRIETHQQEAKEMLNRISKAEIVYAMQNKGFYADMPTLVNQNLLPEDIKSFDSTGYNYKISLSPDKKGYSAKAEPAIYGKTGKLSFWFEVNGDKTSALISKDEKGKPNADSSNL